MGKARGFAAGIAVCSAVLLTGATCAARAQKTAPNETRHPVAVRSTHSRGADLTVPLCPSQFHDSLASDSIAGPHEPGVTPAKATHEVPAQITQDAIRASGRTHIGNYHVLLDAVIDKQGQPTKVCLEKSSGYGLDASAATAVTKYRFKPARKDGKPVAMRIEVDVPFTSPNPPESPGQLPPP